MVKCEYCASLWNPQLFSKCPSCGAYNALIDNATLTHYHSRYIFGWSDPVAIYRNKFYGAKIVGII